MVLESVLAHVRSWIVSSGLPDSYSSYTLVASIVAILVAILYRSILSNSHKNKRSVGATDLLQSSYSADEVKGKHDEYVQYYESGDRSEYDKHISQFYNLVTDFYEYGWGESFHFAHQRKGESLSDAILRHEKRIVDALGLKPGMKVLDCGCGVGGPARNIARMSGAHVTGITISDYQIKRGNEHCVRDKLDHLVKLVQGDFLKMPFADATFDAAYAIEATCHSPTLDAVYGEIFRVLKPGAKFCAYEWVKSASFNPNDPEDEKICDEINYSNGLPNMRHQDDVVPAGEKVGFRKVVSEDLVLSAEVRWYEKLLISRLRYWATDVLCRFLELIRYAPKGTSSVHKMLMQAGDSLVRSGLKGCFTPMFWVVFEKP